MRSKGLFFFILWTGFSGMVSAAEYYVSISGDDGNPGTLASPLRTIQVGIAKLYPGDVLHILPGVYKESAHIVRSGTEGNPVRITAEPGTVWLDGTEEITGDWIQHEGEIYKTYLPGPVEQLFFNDTAMVEARWPNMTFPDDLWKRGVWASSDNGSSLGTMKDGSLAATGIDWTGALAVLNIEAQFWTWTSEVTSHSAGSGTFEYRWDNLAGIRSHLNYNDDSYYLMGKLEALDYPGEWYYDPDSSLLYVYRPGGGVPQAEEISVKRTDYGLSGSSFNNVVVSGLNFFGCTFRFNTCSSVVVEKCVIEYASYSRTIPERIKSGGSAPCTYVNGSNNIVRQCHISYSSGQGLKMIGSHNLVENNLIHDVCWSGSLDYKAISTGNSGSYYTSHNIIRLNTVYNGGNSLLGFSGPYDIVELNHVYAGGKLCKDVSLIYTNLPKCEYSHVRYNWVHNVHPPHIALGIRGDDKTRRLNVYRNVVWDVGWDGIIVKGDENRIYNNTTFDCGYAGIYLETGLEPSKPWHDHIPEVMANENSFTYNNLAEEIYGNRNGLVPPSGDVTNNRVEPNYYGLLVNRLEHDFRPRFGSGLINGGAEVPGVNDPHSINLPDIGAYEYSDTSYWIPGHRVGKASFPIPSDRSRVASDIIDLIWKQAYRAVSYDIYFGNSDQAVRNANLQSAEFMGNQVNNIFVPGNLVKDSSYFWRVDAVFNDSTVAGDVWEFTALSNESPTIYSVTFRIYGEQEEDTVLLEEVEVSTAEMHALTDGEGQAELFRRSAGSLGYSLFKKGFLAKSDTIQVLSDTVVADTMKAAINAYDLKIRVVDRDTREIVPGCSIRLNGLPAISNDSGEVVFNDLSYGFFGLEVEREGYISYIAQDSIELYSDSTITVTLGKDYLQLLLHVVDRTSGENIYRAVVQKGEDASLTGSDGIAEVACTEGSVPITIEHYEYFSYEDTLLIAGDSTIQIELTRTRANLVIEVVSDSVAVEGAEVDLNNMVRQTNDEGEAFYLNIPAREEYAYTVTREGFQEAAGSLNLEVDTVVVISLEAVLSSPGERASAVVVYPNPAKDFVHVKVSSKSKMTLIDVHGHRVMEKYIDPEDGQVDLHAVPPGLYILQLRKDSEMHIIRIQKL